MVKSKIISLPCVNGIYLADNLERMFEEEERRLSPYAFFSRNANRINPYLQVWPHSVIKDDPLETKVDPYSMPFMIDATRARLSMGGDSPSMVHFLKKKPKR